MCLTILEHFFGALLLFTILYSIPLSSVILTDTTAVNISEEIKNIFSNTGGLNHSSDPIFKARSRPEIFAEGGVVHINGMSPNFTSNTEKLSRVTQNNVIDNHKNITDEKSSVQTQNESILSDKHSDFLKNQRTKLNETGSNLFLGVPEVVHINGTSSIKPRKGVYYNKIVPRKGVENENEGSNNSTVKDSCFWISEDECYSNEEMHYIECNCCKEGNSLGKKVKEQPILNCKNCKPVNTLLDTEKHSCREICCQQISTTSETYLVSTTEDIFDNYLNVKDDKRQNVSSIQNNKVPKTVNNSEIAFKEKNKTFKNSTSRLKQKPNITKVPYDVDVMTELLSKAKQRVFVPVVVSIFLIPLLGILIFFIWRRTKDFWEKRYYKKMDFLIDGMYND